MVVALGEGGRGVRAGDALAPIVIGRGLLGRRRRQGLPRPAPAPRGDLRPRLLLLLLLAAADPHDGWQIRENGDHLQLALAELLLPRGPLPGRRCRLGSGRASEGLGGVVRAMARAGEEAEDWFGRFGLT